MDDSEEFQIPDGPPPRPFLDFLVQGGIALVVLVLVIQGISRLGILIGPLIPLAWENAMGEQVMKNMRLTELGPEAAARREVLQRLVDQLVQHEHLPPGVKITVRYSPQQIANAGATFGGNLVVFEGLIAYLPSENSLSMVLAHEISHAAHRDAIRGVSGQVLITVIVDLATGGLTAVSANGHFRDGVTTIEQLTQLQLGREFEERADADGLAALNGVYGHVNGFNQTFDVLESLERDQKPGPEFLSDHPDTARRKVKLLEIAQKNGWKTDGPLTPLRQANFRPGWRATPSGDKNAVTPK